MDEPLLTEEEKLTQDDNEIEVNEPIDQFISDNDIEIFRKEEAERKVTFLKFFKFIGWILLEKWYCVLFVLCFIAFSLVVYFTDWKMAEIGDVTYKTILCLIFVGVMITLILSNLYHPGVVMMAIVGLLIACRVITPAQGFQGFSDRSVITIIVSYILSTAIIKNRSLEFLTRNIFPETYEKHVWPSLLFMVLITFLLSVVIDNIPVVLLSMSIVHTWTKTSGIPPSKVLLPISFSAILGGMNSILGNSSFHRARTLLITKVLELNKKGIHLNITMPYFEIAIISSIISIPALIYIIFANGILSRHKEESFHKTNKSYIFTFRIEEKSRFIGLHLGETVLNKPPNGKLCYIKRGENYIDVKDDTIIKKNDILCYIAPSSILKDVLTYNGVVPSDPTIHELVGATVYEIALSPQDTIIGQDIKMINERGIGFLGISIDENKWKEQLNQINILSSERTYIVLSPQKQELKGNDFHLVTQIDVDLPQPTNIIKTIVPIFCLLIPCILESTKVCPLFVSGFASALVLIITQCMTVSEIYQSIDVQVICVIAASYGITSAIQTTHIGTLLTLSCSQWFISLGKYGILMGIFLPTILLAQPFANTVIVDIMFPMVWHLYYGDSDSAEHGSLIGIKSAMYTMMIASSSSFLLTIGYPTHMIINQKAHYTLKEVFLFGLPIFLWVFICGALLPYLFFEVL
ncbi:citrate transporter, putative [Entamoeba histolytica HM-1:IMSS-B]|uniref:Sodium/sulfate symporter, putative n=4 Tax=Entamoeba histolytica TaxID=5759 RepID=C4LT55_ENTH1|nr:sodium/sulfate symporter, putative [Entamoeba histolytica HM-1:IMSS]EAL52164.1 sodium/sulfate symporter, putative [Entamoeba histolytica HM-1:IMSS]EMH75340.1 citrate transporter, putative [Entamoeba histolytica HM-1:IMSS-B]ENY61161.1 sodium/sulfate transporter, putative [Entamoeba histolytica HM-1:IMSS-A]GAT91728.1 citrate transporter putative [Entamoeba histolytica]|eukprot:XP_657578.1 sodium/sulfate symporter, putative [Entamoeba histolytica HM-1:IMSS]